MRRDLLPIRPKPLRQHREQAMDIAGLEVEPQRADREHVVPEVLADPVRRHVHAGDGARRRPEVPVDHPLRRHRPLHSREPLLHPLVLHVVDRRVLAV